MDSLDFDGSLTLSTLPNSFALTTLHYRPLEHFDTSAVSIGPLGECRPSEERISIMKTVQKLELALPETSSPRKMFCCTGNFASGFSLNRRVN